jgi:hypothetical protein
MSTSPNSRDFPERFRHYSPVGYDRVSPLGKIYIPTARKKRRKSFCPKEYGSFRSFGQMFSFLENYRSATVFQLVEYPKPNFAMVRSNSFPLVQHQNSEM